MGGASPSEAPFAGRINLSRIQEQYGPRHGYRLREQAIFVNTIRLWPTPIKKLISGLISILVLEED